MKVSAPTNGFSPPAKVPADVLPLPNRSVLRLEARLHGFSADALLVKVFPYRRGAAQMTCRRGGCRLMLHPTIASAPVDVFQAALQYLFGRLAGRRTNSAGAEHVRQYIRANPDFLRAQPRPARQRRCIAPGAIHDLKEIFQAVNQQFFNDQVVVNGVGWTVRKARRKLAYYNLAAGVIYVSRLLDVVSVPRFYLEYLLYHEMLHVVLPSERRHGRTIHHHRQFRQMERAHPYYKQAREFERTQLPKL